jgi:hypothetical protein
MTARAAAQLRLFSFQVGAESVTRRQTCAACRHWDRYEGGEGSLSTNKGDCRRHPPRISEALLTRHLPGLSVDMNGYELELDIYTASAFPVTHETSLCGEFAQPEPVIPVC